MSFPQLGRCAALSLGGVLVLAGCANGTETNAEPAATAPRATSTAASGSEPDVSVDRYEESDADLYTINVNAADDGEVPSAYDPRVRSAVDTALQDLQESGNTPQQPLWVLDPFGTNTTGLYVRFATEGEGSVDYTVESDNTKKFSRTAKDHNDDPQVFEGQIIGLVPGRENTVTVTWRPDGGDPVRTELTVTAPETEAKFPVQLDRDLRGDPEQLSDGMFLFNGSYKAGPYGFLFDNAGAMRAELPIDGHMLDRMEKYEDTAVYPVGDHTLARVNGLGRVVQTYDLGQYEMHHDFSQTEDASALILATDTSRDSTEDILLSLDYESGEYRVLVDFAELLEGYKKLTNPYEAPDTDGETVDDWLHLNSIDYHEGEDSVVVSGRENSTIIKVGDVHGTPELDYLIGLDELWDGSGHEDDLLTKDGDFPDTAGQHSVFRHEDDSLDDDQYLLTMFDNSYWRVLSREDYTGPAPDGASEVSGTDPDENSFVRTFRVDEDEGTYTEVHKFAVPYSSIVSNVQHVGSNSVVNSGQAFVLSEYDDNDEIIASYPYDGEKYSYRGLKYALDDFWFSS